MKKVISGVVLSAVIFAIGFAVGQWWPETGEMSARSETSERRILYYKAPMDPNYRRDTPGKSPMGMELVPVYADEAGDVDPAVVSIDPTIVSNLGVRSAVVKQGVLSRRIDTVGYISYDEDTIRHIHTRADGWIEKLSIKATGDPVKRGQILFEFYSPTLVNAQEEYLATLQSTNAPLRKASRQRLAAFGVDEAEIKRLESERKVRQRVRVYAEHDGFVADLGVREGIYITAATDVMSIAALDSVWVLVEVFERQAAWVETGQRAEVRLDYLPGEVLPGTVDYIYPELDAVTRTLKVRLRFDNTAKTLRPNMFSRVTIFGTETPPVVHVPQEALIRGGVVDRLVLALGDGRFRAQPVEVGMESGDRIEIRSGVAAGDRVVISGQFLIDSESNIETALARMDQSSEQPPTRVVVAAVVRGIDAAEARVRLEHEAIAEWSWPAMTMVFDVAEQALLEGLDEGASVDVAIERHGDDHYLITDITRGDTADHSSHEMPVEGSEPDHSQHDMGSGQ